MNLAPAAAAVRQRSFQVFVVVPVYNEEPNLPGLLSKLDRYMTDDWLRYQLIVVDDGSTDRSAQILQQFAARLPLSVYRHSVNQGLGPTIRDGLLAAAGMAADDDIVITMDADETHTPGLILSMLRLIREGHDVVIASRYRPGSRVYGLQMHRRLISWAASFLMRMVFPMRGVRDYTCGYRAYRGSALKCAISHYGDRFLDQDGFQCMVDLLLKLRSLPLVFGEVPLILRYDQKKGASKMRLLKTSTQTLRLLFIRRLGL